VFVRGKKYMKKFLTAKWLDLVMANYRVKPALLSELVPRGTELDFWNSECYASLVAFKFFETKVLGIPVPFHRNFLEVNLRFYVKREAENETKRGVVFVKEIVPRLAIALIARHLYGEPYETWRMSHTQTEKELSYFWSKGKCENQVTIQIGENFGVPETDSHGEFIIEHYWGYTKRGANRTDEYKVEHPKWELFNVTGSEIKVDFGKTYGEKFAFLSEAEPKSILLAKGSEIAVYKGAKL
jgi:uncharacterized protein YqjF (DUF2071 family)